MRILHTSDWHLGRSFHRQDLLGAQAAFIDHLVATVRAERIDVVAVAGDLYDRALPPVDAVRLLDEALRRIRGTGARAVLISGNHDSMVRLDYGSGLIDAAGVHLRSSLDGIGAPVVIDDSDGPVAFYGIPYLEPDIARPYWGLTDRGHPAAIGHAMGLVHADLGARTGTRSVVLSHAFVTGGDPSDSERDIAVGGAAHVPASIYDGVDYVALGHLHGRQRMSETVRYSGSPIAYSFSEEHHVKGSWIVDLDASGRVHAEFAESPVERRIARISGRLDELLSAPEREACTDHWLQVTLTDPVRPAFPMDRLRERFPHVLNLEFAPDGAPDRDDGSWTKRAADRTDHELVLDFVDWARGEPAEESERGLVRSAFEDMRIKEASS